MTREEVATIVAESLSRPQARLRAGTLGSPWNVERIAAEIQLLHECRINPRQESARLAPPESETEEHRKVWIVVETNEGFLVYFDPSTEEFGLAMFDEMREVESLNVRGDLIGTFLAR